MIRRHCSGFLSFILAGLLSLTAVAADKGVSWQIQKDAEGVQIFTRPKPNSPIKEVLGQTVVPVPHWVLMNVISDFGNYKDFMPHTSISKILKKRGSTVYSYQYLDIPILSDRDYVIAVTNVSYNTPDGIVYKTQWGPGNELAPPLSDDTVRVEVNEGYWLFESRQNGKATKMSYYLYTSPGGNIPSWAVNRGNTSTIPKMFHAIEKQSRLKKYWKAKPQLP